MTDPTGQPGAGTGGDPLDICECGDYRRDHDATGCRVCRASDKPWDVPGCTFRLHQSIGKRITEATTRG